MDSLQLPNGPLRILLTNGRFPVSLDLARQLHALGHTVFVVDPMRFHISKFSRVVKKCFMVPPPHTNGAGYVESVLKIVSKRNIQLIIPLHEEIFFLAQVDALRPILFAPPFHTLIAMHNKWDFYELVTAIGCDAPPSVLCRSLDDVRKLELDTKEYALKPCFGRAMSGIFHLKPGMPLPDVVINEDQLYIAQEWINGKQLCSYSVARNGDLKVAAVYPVIDTIDGSSCVFFKSINHPKAMEFMEKFARAYNVTGQMAFDFIESPDGRLMVIECNPRATSGIHLFKHTPWLGDAFTNYNAERHDAVDGTTRQLLPGMLMWEHSEKTKKQRAEHIKRVIGTRDVTFGKSDPLPAIMQPFLFVTYAKQCHKKNLKLKVLFQDDMIWEPTREEIERAKKEGVVMRDRVAKTTNDEVPFSNSHPDYLIGAEHPQPTLANPARHLQAV